MKRRSFFRTFFIYYLILIPPLGAVGQSDPEEIIHWSCKAVRADANHFDFFIEAHIKRGWELYKPNEKKCLLSPTISFAAKTGLKPVGGIDVIEGSECDTMERFCLVPRYRNHVKFIQSFQMPEMMSQVVSGKIVYQPINKNYAPSPFTYSFSLRVGDTTDMLPADYFIKLAEWHKRDLEGLYIDFNKISSHKTWLSRIWYWIRHPFN